MCSVFGLIDHKQVLTTRERNRLLNVLARECEVRGTDATGIAYHFAGRLRIFKRPLPAHKLRLRVPQGVHVILGHTRMTTQGNEKFNQNNHPFAGAVSGKPFALAHNGILWNDKTLRQQEHLPQTSVETDSYIAVQLLEQQKTLDFASLKNMAEKVEGSFVFTVLDGENSIWLVKGDNPLCLFHYDGFTLYASTQEILVRAVRRLGLGTPERIQLPEEGEILRIALDGSQTSGRFLPWANDARWWRYAMYDPWDEPGLHDDLLASAKAMGVSEAEVQALLDYGCAPDEIEELLYDPAMLHEMTGELLYAY